jgi:general secretion pathway protein A
MLNSYFRFSCSPFENTLEQRFMYLSACHEEVIAALLYFIREKKSFALVSGDVGTGKTMIIHHVLGKLPRSVLPILIPYPDVEYIEILRYIARVLNISHEGRDILELTDDVKAALIRSSLDDRQAVLIIDEAHLLSINSLEHIRLISNIETAENKLLQTLLIGQNELSVNLQKREMRQFRQRININRVLTPMKPSETIEYIDHRLKIAGSSFDRCFEPGCRKALYEMTGGVPRSINRLCDTALLICMTEKGDKVTKGILKKAEDALHSDMVHAPAARPQGASFHARKFKSALAAAALIVLIALGALAYRENLVERLKGWLYGGDVRKIFNVFVEKYEAPVPGAEGRNEQPQVTGKDGSSGAQTGGVDQQALSAAPVSPETLPGEARGVNNAGETVNAGEKVPPAGEAGGAGAPEPGKTESDEQTGDNKPGAALLPGDGSEPEAGIESGTPAGAVNDAGAEKVKPGSSDFILVTVKRGEFLNEIVERLFPQDQEAGKKAILAANPRIHDENLVLAGQTLRVPRSVGIGLKEDK